MIRLLLNGKKAAMPEIRSAIHLLRDRGYEIEVRVTWEQGDVSRLVNEAVRDGVKRIVAGGGDGTVNEVCDAVAKLPADYRPEVGILPLGTANDFATACLIPTRFVDALELALTSESRAIDIGKANDHHFINIATGGFGALITTETPIELKNFLGGGAYTLTGIAKALDFTPDRVHVKTEQFETDMGLLVSAVCNGRQAGGGQQLAPDAMLDDGLLDIMLVTEFPLNDLDVVISELLSPEAGDRYVKRFRTAWAEGTRIEGSRQVNLDGEPYFAEHFRFEALPKAIRMILPEDCPCVGG